MDLISVIVTTYNWPEALDACLASLMEQHDKHFEIIIADDGSTDSTHTLVRKYIRQAPVPVRHIFHEDLGFRAGTIRNKAAAAANGNYLIFLDGDCSVLPHFVGRHRRLAETGFFVPGNRILLNKRFTEKVLAEKHYLHQRSLFFFLLLWIQGKINRVTPLIYTPFSRWRYLNPDRWEKAMTCNLALYKQDFYSVNGFDEEFEGWGYEDSDLVVRLIHYGIKRKEGRFAVFVLHHWHRQNDRSLHDENFQRLMERVDNLEFVTANRGVKQYLI